jgi:shikimate kinase
VIEKNQDRSIAAIFEKQGEDHFRKIENAALRSLAATTNCIIACGGGTPCFYDNMQWMNEHGTTVYIEASPQYILSRVKAEKDKRPLISKLNEAELLFFIEQKLKEREHFYKQARIILPVADLNENSLSNIHH